MKRTQILVHKLCRPTADLTRVEFRLWRRLTTVLTFTMRPLTRCCPSLSSGLAEIVNKYSVLYEGHSEKPDKNASPALLNFTKSTARFLKPSRKCTRVFVM